MKVPHDLIRAALEEDIGSGDITSEATISAKIHGRASLYAKQSITLCGSEIAHEVFRQMDANVTWTPVASDGDKLNSGAHIASGEGNMRSLLAAERTALNFLQRLSGIATLTQCFVEKIHHTKAKILDTRKTTPLWRTLEKYAVRTGGGTNHRVGLYDRYLIKNNHITAAGGIEAALQCVHEHQKKDAVIEIEVAHLPHIDIALRHGADIIMLDNMSVDMVNEAVKKIDGRAKIEVSGNITLENVANYAETGVDFISVGALTHSAPAADIHMKID